VRGAACTFRTVYPVTVTPLALTGAAFSAIIPSRRRAPAGRRHGSGLSLTLTATADQLRLGRLPLPRCAYSSTANRRSARRCATPCSCARWARLEADRGPKRWRWFPLAIPIEPAGFDDDESLIDFPARSHAAYRLLTEYFCFPDKFNFFDIDLAALAARRLPAAGATTSPCTWRCPACARIRTRRACSARCRRITCCSAARPSSTCSASAASRSA
jgi:type VI secretion system protein ImpG